jgi:hypothetical protein
MVYTNLFVVELKLGLQMVRSRVLLLVTRRSVCSK